MEDILEGKSLEMCFKILDFAVGPIETTRELRKKIIIARITFIGTVAMGIFGEVFACFAALTFQERAHHFSAAVGMFAIVAKVIHYKINYNNFQMTKENLADLIKMSHDERFSQRHHITRRINLVSKFSEAYRIKIAIRLAKFKR